jgi:hypothetical protein
MRPGSLPQAEVSLGANQAIMDKFLAISAEKGAIRLVDLTMFCILISSSFSARHCFCDLSLSVTADYSVLSESIVQNSPLTGHYHGELARQPMIR